MLRILIQVSKPKVQTPFIQVFALSLCLLIPWSSISAKDTADYSTLKSLQNDDAISQKQPNLDDVIEDAPFLKIEENLDYSQSSEVFQVVEKSRQKQGNPISRLFARIGDGLSGKKITEKSNEDEPSDEIDLLAAQTAQKTVDDLTLQSAAIPFEQVLGNDGQMGFDASIDGASGFRVLDHDAETTKEQSNDVRHSWQDLSEVLGSPTAWSDRHNSQGDDNLPLVNIHRSGRFSVELHDSRNLTEMDNVGLRYADNVNDLTRSSPNLVLNMDAGPGGKIGAYRFSAVGRQLLSKGYYGNDYITNRTYGWGVNFAGDWRFGGLNAGLSLAMGEGIDSLLLPVSGEDVYTYDDSFDTTEVISVVPSIRYSFANRSQFKVAFGRYTNTSQMAEEQDTLDTVHVGYSWSGWNDSLFGVEFTDQRVDGSLGELESDKQIRFGLRRKF